MALPILCAQQPCAHQIQPQTRIKVHLCNGEMFEGTFVEASASEITLRSGGRTRKVGRQEIQFIGKRSRAKGALLGALIGLEARAPAWEPA